MRDESTAETINELFNIRQNHPMIQQCPKFINIFSSLSATLIFMVQGVMNYKLGVILGITMFIGGVIGGRISFLSIVTLRKTLESGRSH